MIGIGLLYYNELVFGAVKMLFSQLGVVTA